MSKINIYLIIQMAKLIMQSPSFIDNINWFNCRYMSC